MGMFGAIGVPVSLALTLLCLPAFLGASRSPSLAQRNLSNGFEHLVVWLQRRRWVGYAVFAGFAILAAAGLPGTRWEDDPSELMAADPERLAESERVRLRVADFDSGRFVVGLAGDREAALALNDEIHSRLQPGIAAGDFEGMMSLHSFIWSQALQRENLEALRRERDLTQRIDEAFSPAGFRAGAFDGFEGAIAQPRVAPLVPDDFDDSHLARVMDSLVALEGRWAVVTYLRGIRSGDVVRARLGSLDGAHYLDQREIVGEVYQGFRETTVRMVALGSAVVFIVLVIRYREILRGLLAFLPPALAALATFGLFGLLEIPVNVVSAVSLLVVLGMGVDYGIFTVDGAARPERLGPTLSSLLISCLTSICVFGILALSEQTALRSLGLTVGIGTTFALILSPPVYVLARQLEARRDRAG
jgi:predicted exporter